MKLIDSSGQANFILIDFLLFRVSVVERGLLGSSILVRNFSS